ASTVPTPPKAAAPSGKSASRFPPGDRCLGGGDCMDLKLAGRSVLITGGSKGIGLATAKWFAAEGVNLALVARSSDALQKAADGIREASAGNVETMAADLSDAVGAGELPARFARGDIPVKNAGAVRSGNIETVEDGAWRAAWDLKMFGYINMTRLYFARMKARRRGVIINIIGIGGERLDFNYIAGSTGNAGLIAFTRALGGRSPDFGVRVLGVNPGPAPTRGRGRPGASSGWGASAPPPSSAIPSAGPRSSSTCRGAARRRPTRSRRRSSSSPRISPPIPAAPC